MSSKHIAFNVVGTLISLDHLFTALESHFSARLHDLGIQPKFLATCWLKTADPEYTFLSLSGYAIPFPKILSALFYRILMCQMNTTTLPESRRSEPIKRSDMKLRSEEP